jgi:DUF1680 family protein
VGAATVATPFSVSLQEQPGVLGGSTQLSFRGGAGRTLTAIPYFAWNNRGLAPMTVWLPLAAH